METIRESIAIQARPEAVFDLISDPCRRARLNPAWTVITCEPLDGGPLRVGLRYRFLTRRGDVRVEHRSRVLECDPPQRLRLRSEIHPDLEIVLTVQSAGAGCILSHAETYHAPPLPPAVAWQQEPDSLVNSIKDLVLMETGGFSLPDAKTWQTTFREQVQSEIRAWLERIREEAERET